MNGPVGSLLLDAEQRAKKKASGTHTSEGACGCRVTVTWFSSHSRTNKFERCTTHEHTRDEKGKKR